MDSINTSKLTVITPDTLDFELTGSDCTDGVCTVTWKPVLSISKQTLYSRSSSDHAVRDDSGAGSTHAG